MSLLDDGYLLTVALDVYVERTNIVAPFNFPLTLFSALAYRTWSMLTVIFHGHY